MVSKIYYWIRKNPYHVVNGVLTHYHIYYYPYLGLLRCDIIITPCDYMYYTNAMDLPWYPYLVPKYRPSYYSVTKFKYYPILG